MRVYLPILLAMAPLFAGVGVAQEPTPTFDARRTAEEFLREKKPNATPTGTPRVRKPAPPVATPSPDAFVAIVNKHRMTRAELERQVGIAMRGLGAKALLDDGRSTLLILDENARVDPALVGTPAGSANVTVRTGPGARQRDTNSEEDESTAAEKKKRIEDEIREEYRADSAASWSTLAAETIQRWTDQRLLADEARRQGIVLSDAEFRDGLAEARRKMQYDSDEASNILRGFSITEQNFESEVYDTLLIKRMLERYVDANWTRDDFETIYEAAPEEFVQVTRIRLAQYVIALEGTETERGRENLRRRADDLREALRKAKNPADVLAPENDPESGIYADADSGWMALEAARLPGEVLRAAARLRVGDVSDVIVARENDAEGRPRATSYHVIKVLDRVEALPNTFENALPLVRERAVEYARIEFAEMLKRSGRHTVITNLRMIAPDKVPSMEVIERRISAAEPMPLVRAEAMAAMPTPRPTATARE